MVRLCEQLYYSLNGGLVFDLYWWIYFTYVDEKFDLIKCLWD